MKARIATQTFSIALTAARVPAADGGGLGGIRCLSCPSLLDVHQPEPTTIDRFLATCEHCGAWYVVEAEAERPELVIVRLPESDAILGVLEGATARGKPGKDPGPAG
jgi:hypothetical protein